jgi:hypothetical protein
LKTKYNAPVDICDDMLRAMSNKRPTCEEILKKLNFWALSGEFEINDELKKELIPKLVDENQVVFSILKSNLDI